MESFFFFDGRVCVKRCATKIYQNFGVLCCVSLDWAASAVALVTAYKGGVILLLAGRNKNRSRESHNSSTSRKGGPSIPPPPFARSTMLRHAAAHLARRARETAAGAQVRAGTEADGSAIPGRTFFRPRVAPAVSRAPRAPLACPLFVCVASDEWPWAAGLQTRGVFCVAQTPQAAQNIGVGRGGWRGRRGGVFDAPGWRLSV